MRLLYYASDGNPVLRGASGEMGKFGKLKFTEAWYPGTRYTGALRYEYIRYNTDARSLSVSVALSRFMVIIYTFIHATL